MEMYHLKQEVDGMHHFRKFRWGATREIALIPCMYARYIRHNRNLQIRGCASNRLLLGGHANDVHSEQLSMVAFEYKGASREIPDHGR